LLLRTVVLDGGERCPVQLGPSVLGQVQPVRALALGVRGLRTSNPPWALPLRVDGDDRPNHSGGLRGHFARAVGAPDGLLVDLTDAVRRSEEHTSELQSR